MSGFKRTIIKDFTIATDKMGSVKESIRQNIFLCKEVSDEIELYVTKENWGIKNRELYHLLDYKFRICCINKTIKVYYYWENGLQKKVCIFHTGLLRRMDSKHLFMVCQPNTQRQPEWMVQPKPTNTIGVTKAHEWLLTKDEINKKYGKFGIKAPEIIYYGQRKQFDRHCKVYWNWYDILNNQLRIKSKRKMIMDELNDAGVDTSFIHKKLVNILCKPFDFAVKKTLRIATQNNNCIKEGLFINKDKQSYEIDLMMLVKLQLYGKEVRFVIRFKRNPYRNQYDFIDLLNLKRGYQNGRQLTRLPSFWWYETENMLRKYAETHYDDSSTVITDDTKSVTSNDSDIKSQISSDTISTINTNNTSNTSNNTINNTSNIDFQASCVQSIKNHVKWENNNIAYELNETNEFNTILQKNITKKQTIWYDKRLNNITTYTETNNSCSSIIKNALTNNVLSKTEYVVNNSLIAYVGIDYQNGLQYSFVVNLKNYQTTFNFESININVCN